MARLGSEENPAVIHVKTPERAGEITEICNDRGWQFIIGIEPDKPEDISDVEKLLALGSKMKKPDIGRNEPCPCGSGKKYKKCCINKEIDSEILSIKNLRNIGDMEPLYSRLPELAEKETRNVLVMPCHKLPPGIYSMIESYCNDKECDCRRVFINVEHNGKIVATIGYGWETKKFYEEWCGDKELVEHLQGPVLEPGNVQTSMSGDILEFFKETMIIDITFMSRLESHYEAFKNSL